MNASSHKFILTGNGAFVNRGCEAIFRGTVRILEEVFGPNLEIITISHGTPEWITQQSRDERDPRVTHLRRPTVVGKSWARVQRKLNRLFGWSLSAELRELEPILTGACAVLSAGGDNYSLDYGYPYGFLAMDRLVQKLGIPLFIWGASIGPFSNDRRFERLMMRHLSRVTGVFVREKETQDYLARHGVDRRVHLVADPAYCLLPQEPCEKDYHMTLTLPVGVNISRMLAHYATHGDIDAWISQCADIVISLMERFQGNVLLIPHVTHSSDCDHSFMSQVVEKVEKQLRSAPEIVPKTLSAAEYKWIISQCQFLIGARTHSTIAAFSTGVPTISLAYSRKAWGLNSGVYGTTQYCLASDEVSKDSVNQKITLLLRNEAALRSRLHEVASSAVDQAIEAGRLMRGYLS